MRHITLFIFFTAARLNFIAQMNVPIQQLQKTDELFVDSIMNSNFSPDGPGAVILIAKNGSPVFKKAYGLANVELNVPNKSDYLFNIGSMSKQFTSICVLKLAQEGKLNLNDDIKKHLPDYNTHGRKITIEDVLHHTSGIYNYSDKSDFFQKSVHPISKEELKKYFMDDSLLFEPNKFWSYCNSGYVVAGLIVEKVSGKSLAEFLKSEVFVPCGMKNTYVENYDSVFTNLVSGYENINGKENTNERRFKPATYISWTYAYGAGGIISTVDDLLSYNNALLSEKILKKEWLDKAWTPYVLPNGYSTNYGLGWAVGNYQGLKFIAHGGALFGFRSYGVVFPDQNIYVAVLSNNSAKTPVSYASPIAFKIAGKPLPAIKSSKTENKLLDDYKGTYKINSPAYDFLPAKRLISVKDGMLFSQLNVDGDLGPEQQLYYLSKDFYSRLDSPQRFKFIRDKKGKVLQLEVYNEPIQYGPVELNIKDE